MGKRDNETMAEFAQRAVEGFKVEPYEVVDKALREGAKEASDFFKEYTEKALTFVGEGASGG